MCPLTQNISNSEKEKYEILLETGSFPDSPIPTKIIGKKIIVFNHIFSSLLYGYERYFGTPVGIKKPKHHIFDTPLELSSFESLYLLKKNIIFITSGDSSKPLTIEEFIEFAQNHYSGFSYKYSIYEDLRNKKYVPRPGQKFGADFIVYEMGPGQGHSSFCIKVKSGDAAIISSLDVVTAGRLATSVKKNFIIANPKAQSYYKFKWFKP